MQTRYRIKKRALEQVKCRVALTVGVLVEGGFARAHPCSPLRAGSEERVERRRVRLQGVRHHAGHFGGPVPAPGEALRREHRAAPQAQPGAAQVQAQEAPQAPRGGQRRRRAGQRLRDRVRLDPQAQDDAAQGSARLRVHGAQFRRCRRHHEHDGGPGAVGPRESQAEEEEEAEEKNAARGGCDARPLRRRARRLPWAQRLVRRRIRLPRRRQVQQLEPDTTAHQECVYGSKDSREVSQGDEERAAGLRSGGCPRRGGRARRRRPQDAQRPAHQECQLPSREEEDAVSQVPEGGARSRVEGHAQDKRKETHPETQVPHAERQLEKGPVDGSERLDPDRRLFGCPLRQHLRRSGRPLYLRNPSGLVGHLPPTDHAGSCQGGNPRGVQM